MKKVLIEIHNSPVMGQYLKVVDNDGESQSMIFLLICLFFHLLLLFFVLVCVCVGGGGKEKGRGGVGGVRAIIFICDILYQPNTHRC